MLNVSQAARRKGCDRRTINRALADGALKLFRGSLREADVDAWEPIKKGRPRVAEIEAEQRVAERRAKAEAQPTAGDDPEPPPTPAQRLKLIELARAEREWAKEQGDLVDRAEVVKLLAAFGHRIRSEFQSHPRKMQAELTRKLRCRECGGGVDGKHIAIAAEKYVADLLRIIADDPFGGV